MRKSAQQHSNQHRAPILENELGDTSQECFTSNNSTSPQTPSGPISAFEAGWLAAENHQDLILPPKFSLQEAQYRHGYSCASKQMARCGIPS